MKTLRTFITLLLVNGLATACAPSSSKTIASAMPLIVERQVTVEVTREVVVTAMPEVVNLTAPRQTEPTGVETLNIFGAYSSYGMVKDHSCYLEVAYLRVSEIPTGGRKQYFPFYLFCNYGEPSYNMGGMLNFMHADREVAIHTPTYIYKDENCELFFSFSKDKVEVIQNGSDFDCGFGHGVYANGTYKKIND